MKKTYRFIYEKLKLRGEVAMRSVLYHEHIGLTPSKSLIEMWKNKLKHGLNIWTK